MFDSGMSAAAIVARVQELQAAAGIKAQLVNPAGRGAGMRPRSPPCPPPRLLLMTLLLGAAAERLLSGAAFGRCSAAWKRLLGCVWLLSRVLRPSVVDCILSCG
jgi:hypothetical protein